MRPVVPAIVASGLAALACSSNGSSHCPGATVAVFLLKGPLVSQGDPDVAAVDPVPSLPDCTPDPFDSAAPLRYPHLLPPFEAKLATDAATSAASLCRSNGTIYFGERTGATHYTMEADASPAAPCASSACAVTLRVIVVGDVSVDAGGAPRGFDGILVEALAAEAGACDTCLPPVPGTTPPQLACAARYKLTGTPQ